MNETFKAGLNSRWTVTDTHLIYKKNEILYTEITSIKEFCKASTLTNGVWQIGVRGKIHNLAFLYKDREKVLPCLDFIKDRSGIARREFEKLSAIEANPMLSAAGMYQYAVDNGLGSGFSKGTGEKHFAVLEKNLMVDEVPMMTFIGLHNFISSTKHSGNYAFALTNKRIILGQWKLIGEHFQSVKSENINDITFSSGLLMGVLTVDSLKEKFNIGLDKISAQKINLAIHEGFEKLRNPEITQENKQTIFQSSVNPDDLRKYKLLLDDGVISQEDFDQKKKQILGL